MSDSGQMPLLAWILDSIFVISTNLFDLRDGAGGFGKSITAKLPSVSWASGGAILSGDSILTRALVISCTSPNPAPPTYDVCAGRCKVRFLAPKLSSNPWSTHTRRSSPHMLPCKHRAMCCFVKKTRTPHISHSLYSALLVWLCLTPL